MKSRKKAGCQTMPSNPLTKGTYALILFLENNQNIQIGKLGRFKFPKGYYIYVGSAFGPGGLNARLTHHFKPAVKPHWHIDYIKKKAVITNIRIDESGIRLEHQWASILQERKDATIPVPKFGASDCKCASHLFHFQDMPVLEELGPSIPFNTLNIP